MRVTGFEPVEKHKPRRGHLNNNGEWDGPFGDDATWSFGLTGDAYSLATFLQPLPGV